MFHYAMSPYFFRPPDLWLSYNFSPNVGGLYGLLYFAILWQLCANYATQPH